jgi:hypothetical protein
MQTAFNGGQVTFANDCNRLQEYIAFNNTGLLVPIALGKIPNQNLHNSAFADYIIVAHPAFLSQAQRLAAFHQQTNGRKPFGRLLNRYINEAFWAHLIQLLSVIL